MIAGGEASNALVTFYWSPGRPIFKGKKTQGSQFILFLYLNMDEGHRVLWFDLCGRKQSKRCDFIRKGDASNTVHCIIKSSCEVIIMVIGSRSRSRQSRRRGLGGDALVEGESRVAGGEDLRT